jgi:putative copper export protein
VKDKAKKVLRYALLLVLVPTAMALVAAFAYLGIMMAKGASLREGADALTALGKKAAPAIWISTLVPAALATIALALRGRMKARHRKGA